MVAPGTKPGLGMGLYTPGEAALYARLKPQTFNRWFFGQGSAQPVATPRIEDGGEANRVVTFWDLIQAVAIRNLRRDRKASRMSLQHIRSIVTRCEEMGVSFPFARRHTLYAYSDRLILRTEDDQYVGIEPGVDVGQLYHFKIIEQFLEEIQFGGDRMARVWTPLASPKYEVSLNSDRRFGLPIIEPGGILVDALVQAVESEGSVDAAAEAFETKPEAVKLALKYQDYLDPAA